MKLSIFNITSNADDEDVKMNLIVEQFNPEFVKQKNNFIQLADLYESEIDAKGYTQLSDLIKPLATNFSIHLEQGNENNIIQAIEIYLLLISTIQAEKFFSVDFTAMYNLILESIKKLKKKQNANN